jgi:hypothetical protein
MSEVAHLGMLTLPSVITEVENHSSRWLSFNATSFYPQEVRYASQSLIWG